MKQIRITRGLDIPISGRPDHTVTNCPPVRHVALVGDDYLGMKPTMLVEVGDHVDCGQPVFSDKKNEGVVFTAPGSGEVVAINRGAKRKFESLIIRLAGEGAVSFCPADSSPADFTPPDLRRLLIESGLWGALRTRPYGRIPAIASDPASLFVTALDTAPLAPDMEGVIALNQDDFLNGLTILHHCFDRPIYLCLPADWQAIDIEQPGVEPVAFAGPHPAGLPSTHIHFLDPVHEHKTVWHIGAQDVIAVGGLLRTGNLVTERIISLAGPAVKTPRHLRSRLGAAIGEICAGEINDGEVRLLSGSVLDGRTANDRVGFLGRYHQQISCLPEGTGRSFFGWLRPGSDRFSVTRAFLSAFRKPTLFPFDTAVWGGHRAIFPIGTYEQVMPLDIIPTYLLKSLASGNTEKAKQLGCLELIEEDLALCSYVCPGKNDFAPMLRETLTSIETEG